MKRKKKSTKVKKRAENKEGWLKAGGVGAGVLKTHVLGSRFFRRAGAVGSYAVEYVKKSQDRGRLRAAAQKQTIQVRDPGKRHRIFFLSAVLVAFVFGLKVWRKGEWSFNEAIITAAVAAFLTYVGLLWAFRFDVQKDGFFAVLTQPSIFVFCSVLFLTLFFFQRFERFYESLVFGVLLLILAGVLAVVFLTANILNVATVKKLPLLKVAQTSSYVISLFSVYFVTFSLISGGLNVILMIFLLLIAYFLIIWTHLSHFSINGSHVRLYSFSIAWSAMAVIAALLFWPVDLLFIALAPVIVVYIGMGIVMQYVGKTLTTKDFWEFMILAVFTLGVIAFQAKWGIGGFFWE